MHLTGFLQLALIGIVIAAGPLAYAWARSRGKVGARRLVWIIVFFTFDLILFGAFTRLTDSGLGCPDWPGCYGTSNPLAAHSKIKEAEAAMPTGPVTVAKAWIEMIHRYLAMGVGALLIALVALAWRERAGGARTQGTQGTRGDGAPLAIPPPTSVPLSAAIALLVLVCLQGAFGAWTVTLKLMPLVVSIHLLLAVLLLSALGWVGSRDVGQHMASTAMTRWRRPILVVWCLLLSQIALGGWVSTNYAVLACPDFPLCHGQVFPQQADFASGFQLLRPLGVLKDGSHLPTEALIAIHWTHRAFALVIVGVLAWLALGVSRAATVGSIERRLANALMALTALQVATGISNVVFAWPIAVAVMHNGGAAAMALLLAVLHARAGSGPMASVSSDAPPLARQVATS